MPSPFGAARRHPYRAISLSVGLLALVLPIAWYLGSPLFISVSLVEPAPSIASSVGTVAAVPTRGTGTAKAPGSDVVAPSPAPTPRTGSERRGVFHGTDELHFGHGTARLLEVSPGRYVVRFEGFSVRNGPDLYVYLSPSADGYVDGSVEVAPLKATDGDFNTAVPAGTDVSAVRSVLIWCKQFSHLFAVAPLG